MPENLPDSNTIESKRPGKRSYVPTILFWFGAAFMLFWGLGGRELWTAEDRWAEVSRWMILTGDLLHPCINGQPYFDKPLLGYWVIVLTARLIGGLNEWAIRIPSAIAGLLALWATISLGRKLWNGETARLAGWLMLTCEGFIFWARTGQADMANLAAIMLAINWYWGRRDRPGFANALVFYVICLLGAQFKGLAAVAVPCIAVAPHLLRENRWRFLFTLRHLAALLLALGLYFAPFIIEAGTRGNYSSSGLALVFRENIQRYFNPFDHKGAFYIYLYNLPVLFLPWAVLFILGVAACVPRLKQLDAQSRWLVTAAVLVFLFFTASGSRRSYYILPLVPFCALLTARWLTSNAPSTPKAWALRITAGVIILLAVLEILSPLLWPLLKERAGVSLPADFLPSCFAIGTLAIAVWVLHRYRPSMTVRLIGLGSPVAVLLLMAFILMGGFFCRQQLSMEVFRNMKSFCASVRDKSDSPDHVAFYGTNRAAIAFYMDYAKPVQILTDPVKTADFLQSEPGRNLLILSHADYDHLQTVIPGSMQCEILVAELGVSPKEIKKRKDMLAIGLLSGKPGG
jgi:hypothetical protein